ncbi:hypothetical protein UFOVP151_16 [uncultured Caudovirales phage]|uniref:Uncharacterized protein n=1 Tax=uncultured Caudovirales phage TaxID=2100421 RepID=A0A6J7WBL1_9CAUD|nr:hypothetical protein UFOVP151_16 [uncultured Caudovirales phage]
MNNYQLNFTRRSSLSDGHYVRMQDDRLTVKRVIGGLLFAAAFIASFIALASVV